MRREETSRYLVRQGIVSPLQIQSACEIGLRFSALARVDRRDQLISAGILRVDHEDCLSGRARFVEPSERIKRLSELSLDFTVTRVFVCQIAQSRRSFGKPAVPTQNQSAPVTRPSVRRVQTERAIEQRGGLSELGALCAVAFRSQLGNSGVNQQIRVSGVDLAREPEGLACGAVLGLIEQPNAVIVPAASLLYTRESLSPSWISSIADAERSRDWGARIVNHCGCFGHLNHRHSHSRVAHR